MTMSHVQIIYRKILNLKGDYSLLLTSIGYMSETFYSFDLVCPSVSPAFIHQPIVPTLSLSAHSDETLVFGILTVEIR